MEAAKLLAEIAKCDKVMHELSEELRAEINRFKDEETERLIKERKKREKEEARDRKKQEKLMKKRNDELLCKGTWAEHLPLKDRFVLCECDGPRFVDHPEEKMSYCAIDIVRGYMAPYWGYYGYSDRVTPFYEYKLKPLFAAKDDEDKLADRIDCDFNFFKIAEPRNDVPFRVLDYVIGKDGFVNIIRKSKTKRLAQHQQDLRTADGFEWDDYPKEKKDES